MTNPTNSAIESAFVLAHERVNGVVGKKGSIAYDTSKAVANHLVRELAIEMAPTVRVNQSRRQRL